MDNIHADAENQIISDVDADVDDVAVDYAVLDFTTVVGIDADDGVVNYADDVAIRDFGVVVR